MKLLSDKQRRIYEWYSQQALNIEKKAEAGDGKLSPEDWWRLNYFKYPYLLLKDNDEVAQRLADAFSNSVDITPEGKLAPTPMFADEGRIGRIFSEMVIETNVRGGWSADPMREAAAQINFYYENGLPPGFDMFKGVTEPVTDYLVKFSREEFIQEMYDFGRIRISPASFYSKGSHIRAVKDLETSRSYSLMAIKEVLEGETHIDFNGIKVPLNEGTVPLNFMMDDYYLFSTCQTISRRMPTDFDSDAALIIKDKSAFIYRLQDALLKHIPEWEFIDGNVYYYDPYRDIPKSIDQELWKHFSYYYQQEHRCVLRSRIRHSHCLEPFFVELGSLSDISEIIRAKRKQ